jgi:hypothetical protein
MAFRPLRISGNHAAGLLFDQLIVTQLQIVTDLFLQMVDQISLRRAFTALSAT